jgi:hypothetical protein
VGDGAVVKVSVRAAALLGLVAFGIGLLAWQRQRFDPRYGYESTEDGDEVPPDAAEKTEFAFARLHFHSLYGGRGPFRGAWGADWPRADRHLSQGIRRLTRIHIRSVEQVVDIDSDEIFDWPWIYVEHAENWEVNEAEALRLRTYLSRGGFLLFDDIHGEDQWESFMAGLRQIIPDRTIEDLPDNDPIFHDLYDLNERPQVPGTRFLWRGLPYPPDARVPRWRGIRDDHGRLMVAMFENSDVGDAWEWADSPDYPEKFTSFAYRIMINYIVYAMSH